ncbi:hypothetical protein [Caldimonas tepidiphila]|uniref:hypothetical protein n=1 Tax=Caldimonas tepidiphila TaxID=2315841 RepID=UPI00196B9C6D|nr:hypothetical protein [Caldimonas tepidiphila]
MGDLVKGALAGAAAVWVMDRADWFAFTYEDPEARRRTEQVRPGGLDPSHVAVNRVAEMAGVQLSPRQPHPAGIALHYGLGIGPSALYAAGLRDRMAGLGMARGPLFGLGLFLVQDEGLNALSGLSAPPGEYPWQAHARGLLAHLVLGTVVDLALGVMGAGRSSRRSRHARGH